MVEIVVTREDREAAMVALDGEDVRSNCCIDDETRSQIDAWIARGELPDMTEDDEDAAEAYAQSERVAATIARVRIAAERAGYERGVREERERRGGCIICTPCKEGA